MNDYPYWMALAHLARWRMEKINNLIVAILDKCGISLAEFFELEKDDWRDEFELDEKETEDLENAKSELPNYSFLAESLISQGFDLIPINSQEYPETLKQNLKMKYSPSLLYVKGNKQLLHEPSVAIVGARNASEISLKFTRNIAKICVENYQVIVSGFAKGVDKTALDATLEVFGHSIIVLPQGIMTFASGFRKYYTQVVEGDVLILSTFHPRVPWNVGLAMARNTYIYGLAKEIYVAESNSKGGTWSGVIDGLRKGRTIYVRKPNPAEKNANNLLILRGAIPVDMNGKPLESEDSNKFEQDIKNALLNKSLTAKEIKDALHLDINTVKLSNLLSKLDFIESGKGKNAKIFYLKDSEKSLGSLFD